MKETLNQLSPDAIKICASHTVILRVPVIALLLPFKMCILDMTLHFDLTSRSVSINFLLSSPTDCSLNLYHVFHLNFHRQHPKNQNEMQEKVNDTLNQPGLGWQTEKNCLDRNSDD